MVQVELYQLRKGDSKSTSGRKGWLQRGRDDVGEESDTHWSYNYVSYLARIPRQRKQSLVSSGINKL